MFTKVVIDRKILVIPFSSKKVAESFIKGYNNYVRSMFQKDSGTLYCECANEHESRGASFAQNVFRYCKKYGIRSSDNYIAVYSDRENIESLFDFAE